MHFVHDDKGDTSGEWQVLRQDEFGNSFAAKKDVTEYEARRWVEIYEARGHKQLYWCEEKPPLAGVK
ncbi:MAG: hypothetical protein GY822_02660 [Deltaproteobacteria bacterium]|nr:hypothetical protein [Deltaproteobacteria bacterium]